MLSHKLLSLGGATMLALAVTATTQADIVTIDFSDLPVGSSFPQSFVPYQGLTWFSLSGNNQVTATGLEIDSPEDILAFTPGFLGVHANPVSFTVETVSISGPNTLIIGANSAQGHYLGAIPLTSGTTADPFGDTPLEIVAFENSSAGPMTITSLTLDIVNAPEPSQMVSGLAVAGLGALGLWVRRFRNRA